MPFEVPGNWCWVKVADISSVIVYGVSESAKSEGKFKLLRITDIQDNAVNWNTVPYTDYPESKSENYILQAGDILFARTGATVGKSYLVDDAVPENAIYASYLIKVRVSNMIIPQYVKYFFESGFYWEQIANNSVGVGQPNVNGSSLGNLWVPIPPIQEQRRIVDKLVSWCLMIDKLSVNQELITQQIEELRNHILNLAISGKLVAQEPSDEPAIELLKRINPMFSPTHTRHNENLPSGWQEVAFDHIFKSIPTKRFQVQQKEIQPKGTIPVISQSANYIEGYTDDIDKIFTATPVIVFGDHTRGVKFVDFPFVVGADGVKIYSTKIFPPYGYYLIEHAAHNIENKGYGRHSQYIAKQRYPLPPYDEQKRIVESVRKMFMTIDSIVADL